MAPIAKKKVNLKKESTKLVGKVKKTSNKNNMLRGTNVWKDEPETKPEGSNVETKPLFTFNEKGEKVKEFKKQRVTRPWIDIKYEENDRMTFYDGFYVKREAVEDLDKLKRSLELEGLSGDKVKNKMMKPLRKANRVLFKELLYEQKFDQIKKGTYTGPVKVWSKKELKEKTKKDGKGKENLKSNNNSKLDTKIKNTKNSSCPSSIEGLDLNFQISDNEASDDEENKSKLTYKGTSYTFVDTNVNDIESSDGSEDSEMEEDEDAQAQVSKYSKSENFQKKPCKINEKNEQKQSNGSIKVPLKSTDQAMEVDESALSCKTDSEDEEEDEEPQIEFKENSLMTCVEGFWVRRSKLDTVASLREAKKKEIIMARPDGDTSPMLTEEETAKYKAALKVELNKLSNQLRAFLRKVTKKHSLKAKTKHNVQKKKKSRLHRSERQALKRGGGGGGIGKKFSSASSLDKLRGVNKNLHSSSVHTKNGLVNFRGYWIKPEGAKRLHELENRLKAEGTSKERIAELIKVERRREENELKRERRHVCFSCRKTGHLVADCPLKRNIQGVGACFKCGSLEHKSDACSQSEFSYAICFICRQKGHISRECPKNNKGLYPHGGGCTLCDSNQHLIKDCPRNTEENKAREELKAKELKAGELLEVVEDDSPAAPVSSTKKKNKNKVVKF